MTNYVKTINYYYKSEGNKERHAREGNGVVQSVVSFTLVRVRVGMCAYICIYTVLPDVVVKYLTLHPRIREVPSSNLGPDAGYLEWGISWIFSVPPGECRDSTSKLCYDRFLPNPFQFIIYVSITFSFDAIILVTENASLNKLQIYIYIYIL
jgi:hypothetical protein